MSVPLIDAFVPAGFGEKLSNYAPLLEAANVTNKAFIKLNNKPMIQYVLEALDQSKYIRSITIFGLTDTDIDFNISTPVSFQAGGKTSFETLKIALLYFKSLKVPPNYVLSLSSDIPLITAEMLDKIIEAIDFNQGIELYYNVVWAKRVKELYPEVTKVPLKLKEADIFFGDVQIMQPNGLFKGNRMEIVEKLMSDRKNFAALIKLVSIRYFLKYIFHRLSIKDAGLRIAKIFDINIGFIMASFPECCTDLDYEKDLEIFKKLIQKPRRKLDEQDYVRILTKKDFLSKEPI